MLNLIMTGDKSRSKEIDRLLYSLRSSTYKNWKLYFVSQDGASLLCNVNYLNDDRICIIETPRIGLSKARNIGLKHCKSDGRLINSVIGFPDDDCWYSEILLDNVISYFHEYQGIKVICGSVYDPVTERYYAGRVPKMKRKVRVKNMFVYPISVGIFISVSNDLIHNTLWFDENLGAGTELGSGEETDLIFRLLKEGVEIEYNSDIMVYHPVMDYKPDDVEKFYRYGYGCGYLCAKVWCKGGREVMWYWSEMMVRSLVGIIVNMFGEGKEKRKVYKARARGLYYGFVFYFRTGR